MAGLNNDVDPRLIAVEHSDDGVTTIQMCDVDGRNGLSEEFVRSLKSAFHSVEQTPHVKAIILCGLQDAFCSGATRNTLEKISDGNVPLEELSLPALLLNAQVPVIAAMEGDAVGGGFALGLAADIILMAEKSRYGLNFVEFGLTPGMGATRIAPLVLGQAIAHELMYTAEFRRGRDFRGHSSINYVLPKDEVMAKAKDVAARITSHSRSTLQLLKTNLAAERCAVFKHAREMETAMHRVCLEDRLTAERIRRNYAE
ncbi:MAG: hypothetical protein GY948_11675 [Alphaproteobacteria bacterium]|nr:hypothetical protein [Alphaproteobacteria bacterium]